MESGAIFNLTISNVPGPRERGDILRQHLEATQALAGEDLDLLVWPENAAEFFADEDPSTILALDRVVDAFDAPLVVGTVTREGPGEAYDPDTDRTPVEASWADFPMSQFDKDDVEVLGLLKLDVLGIRMQSAMAHAVS